jgi:hypothetical protein
MFQTPRDEKGHRVESDAERLDRWRKQARFMEQIGAVYGLLWQRQGDVFVATKDFTSDARRKAMKLVRNDDTSFAKESQKVRVRADGRGPIATTARTRTKQVITDTSGMVRAKLCEEFGIKTITFLPLPTGSVLEFGTPNLEEIKALKLLSLLIQEFVMSRDTKAFALYLLEILTVLRFIIAIEGPANVLSGVRKSLAAVSAGFLALEKEAGPAQSVVRLVGQISTFLSIQSVNRVCSLRAVFAGKHDTYFVAIVNNTHNQ